MNGETTDGKTARDRAEEEERRQEERDDRHYEILEGQKNSNQNRRDAVIVSVSTLGAGFCAAKAAEFADHLFYGWLYLAAGLVFVVTIYFVILSCNECEKAIVARQKELGMKGVPKSAFNDRSFVWFTIGLVSLVVAFMGHFLVEYWGNFFGE